MKKIGDLEKAINQVQGIVDMTNSSLTLNSFETGIVYEWAKEALFWLKKLEEVEE